MIKRLKGMVSKTPVLGHSARVIKRLLALPSYQLAQEQMITRLEKDFSDALQENNRHNRDLEEKYRSLQALQDNIQKQVLILNRYKSEKKGSSSQANSSSKKLFADDHALDVFYASFEDRFRGSETMIGERLKIYLPYFAQSKVNFTKHPVLDIGSGRGEFLKMLGKAKINAMGLDINVDMVNRANEMGLKTEQGDALSFLDKTASQSLGAITGFHIAEHIPFNLLYRIFNEAHRALANDGFVIFETPNPENLVVSGHNFYMDPSHLHPLPPTLLQFTLETCGFSKVEIKRLHPDKPDSDEKLPRSVQDRLYGPRDYAVIGYK